MKINKFLLIITPTVIVTFLVLTTLPKYDLITSALLVAAVPSLSVVIWFIAVGFTDRELEKLVVACLREHPVLLIFICGLGGICLMSSVISRETWPIWAWATISVTAIVGSLGLEEPRGPGV